MLPETMKTIELPEHGGVEVMAIGERPLPTVGDDQILIKIAAFGVNGPDIVQRRGFYPPPPGASDLMGLEVSGTVAATGKNVDRWKLNDEVCALTNGGGYSEYVAVDAGQCLPVPEGVSLIDAAGLPETYFTVWSNVFFNQTIGDKAHILIHGGAGGIGSTAIELAVARGLKVFTTTGKPEGVAFCENLGAHHVINYREQDFVDVVKQNGGADIIVDIVGGDYVERNFKVANPDARIIQLAFNKGSKVEVNLMPIMLKRLTLTGSTLRPRPPQFKQAVAGDLEEKVWPLFAKGQLSVHTHAVFAFDDIRKAHELMESATHQGKILVTP